MTQPDPGRPHPAASTPWWKRWKARLDAFLFGAAASWVLVPHLIKHRQELERLFVMLSSARLMGMPLAPGVEELRLLPYVVPNLLYWQRMTAFDGVLEQADLKHLGH